MQTPCQQSHVSNPTSAVPRQQFRSTWPRMEALPSRITIRLETHTLTSCTMFCT